MSARPALILGLCLTATACATAPKLPERPQVVQLSLSGSPDPCDWSGQYEPYDVPDQWSLGATYWPHTMPRSGFGKRTKTAPLTFYGTQTWFLASETSPILCLRLYKRPSVFHEGLAPVAVVEIRPEGETARVSALRLDPQITRLDLGFVYWGTAPTLSASLIGDQIVQSSPLKGSTEPFPRHSHGLETLSLDMSSGRAEGRMPSLSYTEATHLALIASQKSGQEGAQNTLSLFLSRPLTGPDDARFTDGHLTLHPHFP